MTTITGEPDGATPLDPDEIKGLIFTHVTTRAELNQLEQIAIQEGRLWLNRKRKVEILDDAFLREFHGKLFGNVWSWAGSYRLTEKNIGVDPAQIAVEVRTLTDNTRYWVENGTFAHLELAARFHHRLVQIHPFPNGNGRHARYTADALLERVLGASPINWGGSDLDARGNRRTKYIAALRAADGGDFTPLLQFVGAGH